MARVVDRWHNRDRSRTSRYGSGLRWWAVWDDLAGERKKSFPTKKAAEEHIVWVTHQKRTGAYISEDRGRVLVRELIDEWVSAQVQVKPSTAAAIQSDVRATIKPYWGSRVLADITREDVQAWVAGMDKAPRTVDTIFGRFNGFLIWCVDHRRIPVNPAKGVNLPKGRQREHQFLEVDQVKALVDAADPNYRDFLWLLVTTGLRMGEACELRWRDVDLGRRRLRIERAVVFIGGGGPVVGPPKSGKARTVPLTGKATGILAELAYGRSADDLVFTTARGQQIRANNFKRRYFDDAVSEVNKAATTGAPGGVRIPEGLWVHDLRHTAASWAVQSGASVKSVQRMLGHATAAMTLDVYAGLFDQDLDDVADRMDALIDSPRNAVPLQNRSAV